MIIMLPRGILTAIISTLWLALAATSESMDNSEPDVSDASEATTVTATEEIAQWLEETAHLRSQGDYPAAKQLMQRALDAARRLNDFALVAEAHYQAAIIFHLSDDFARARSHAEVGLTIARLNQLESLEADIVAVAGLIEWKTGNLQEALRLLRRTLDIQKEKQAWGGMASTANNLGIIQISLQNFEEAIAYFQQGLEWNQHDFRPRNQASLLSNMAEALIAMDRLDEAETYLEASFELERTFHDPHNEALTYFLMGELRAKQMRTDEAMAYYQRALQMQETMGKSWGSALTRLRIGKKLNATGDYAAAADILRLGLWEAKSINARSLLRDYAAILAEVHLAQDELHFSDFYRTLHQWLSEEIQPRQTGTDDNSNATNATPEQADAVQMGTTLQSDYLRYATVGILVLIVCMLLFENIRLRKKSRLRSASK